ncbi:A disintegrin and metalloproteinase with thrombospondin motifs 15 [Callorhinchus milii]|uniref:ADAM metallopeptidase with thrombospondin type 1 motif, 15a n=1 Tax=Callorhinchus milii TaxID=7868 RepID=A0A4W3HC27_CALMI|nr:A disintegrin and metalloproteinase with thrombospondin motifs 15 [Callorhinchus milii]|eukprot:gi/632957105/ref/XP_007894294.1/ PREDICTED: A disintegrin and metalloproteinase with thrombospondin motifs 15 [Callorhinchus milii]
MMARVNSILLLMDALLLLVLGKAGVSVETPTHHTQGESEVVNPVRLDVEPGGARRHFLQRSLEDVHQDQRMLFKVGAFSQEFYLDLVPDSSFLGSAFTLQSLSLFPQPAWGNSISHCFYSGSVNRDPSSYAALSLCDGMQGAFGVNGSEYLIQPLAKPPGVGEPSSAHVIHRRSASEPMPPPASASVNITSRCGVSGTHVNLAALEKFKASHSMERPSKGENVGRKSSRSKRFASIPRFVETLLVADESMAKFHGDDLKHYVLMLMAVAARLYKHPSILNPISIVVVKFIVINLEDKGPKISTNAALTLRNFCAWQKKFNKASDKNPEYFDTAILFTKQDLCGAQTCDTLGMADVGTMCDPKRSCSVIEDDGLPSAFTTAHELGHVFNMPHDSVKACENVFGKLKDNHMMSPTLIHINRSKPWSICSAAIVTDFLDSGHGDCLLDEPTKPITLPDSLPGENYNLNRQCVLAFGTNSKPCPYMQSCLKLWCTGKARGQLVCQTRHFPWADGTSCGDGKFCLKGICVERHDVTKYKVDGRWGRWGQYGVCSRTCGGGVQLAERECNNPTPANGGRYCEGIRVKYRSCNLDPCPENGKSFREEQCEAFNGYNINTNRLAPSVVWVPKYSGVSPKDKCKLVCRANGTGYFYVLAPKVVDGTPCMPDTSAVCVQGQCIKAGCDGKLGSKKKFDKCGVCGGDNKSCKKVSGLFTKPKYGYNYIVTIPVGATSIDIKQRGYRGMTNDDNYLAVKNEHDKYLLNGHYIVSAVERDIVVKGSLLRYSGTANSVESLQAFRPIQEPLVIEVLSVGKMTPPRVRYSFYLNKDNKEKQDKSSHSLNKKDSKGTMLNNDSLSKLNKIAVRQPDYKRPSYKWVVRTWSDCSVTCGNGLQHRPVECQDHHGQIAFDCDSTQKPEVIRQCGNPCPIWVIGDWSPCSKSCGKGFKRRIIKCRAGTGHALPREHCSIRKKPQELDFCTVRPC